MITVLSKGLFIFRASRPSNVFPVGEHAAQRTHFQNSPLGVTRIFDHCLFSVLYFISYFFVSVSTQLFSGKSLLSFPNPLPTRPKLQGSSFSSHTLISLFQILVGHYISVEVGEGT